MFSISQHNLFAETLARSRRTSFGVFSLAMFFLATIAVPARAQTSSFTEIYNSGVLTPGAGETLQLTIVNNNSVDDPALPSLSTSAESCTFIAQFLDGNGNTLQKQQQTLAPGQNFSFSITGHQTVQARVDLSPGTSSGLAGLIADQCVVSTEILNTSSNEPMLFPPVGRIRLGASLGQCKSQCKTDCRSRCGKNPACFDFCVEPCIDACVSDTFGN